MKFKIEFEARHATIRNMAQLRRAGDVSAVSGLLKDQEKLNLSVADLPLQVQETALICAARQISEHRGGYQVRPIIAWLCLSAIVSVFPPPAIAVRLPCPVNIPPTPHITM